MFWQSSGKIPATVEGQKADYITGDDYAGYLQQIADGCRPTVSFAGISGLKSALGDAYAAVFSKVSDRFPEPSDSGNYQKEGNRKCWERKPAKRVRSNTSMTDTYSPSPSC